jgi:2-(1,2-epoxy-1,2-dihydrophenyl)acetyl-CoA isomerase
VADDELSELRVMDVLTRDATEGVRTITLNRPERMNALNNDLIGELGRILDVASADDRTRAVILSGNGRAFCAGADLAMLSDDSQSLGERLRDHFNPVILKLATFEKPLVAAINGVAVGAGLSLALACDVRVAARTARLGCAFIQVALVPDCGASFFLPRTLGPARAFELAVSGRLIGSDESSRIGLVDEVVDDGELMGRAAEIAGKFAAGPATAVVLTKRILSSAVRAQLAEALESEAVAQQTASRSPDFAEGVLAFLDKRPARFK